MFFYNPPKTQSSSIRTIMSNLRQDKASSSARGRGIIYQGKNASLLAKEKKLVLQSLNLNNENKFHSDGFFTCHLLLDPYPHSSSAGTEKK